MNSETTVNECTAAPTISQSSRPLLSVTLKRVEAFVEESESDDVKLFGYLKVDRSKHGGDLKRKWWLDDRTSDPERQSDYWFEIKQEYYGRYHSFDANGVPIDPKDGPAHGELTFTIDAVDGYFRCYMDLWDYYNGPEDNKKLGSGWSCRFPSFPIPETEEVRLPLTNDHGEATIRYEFEYKF